MKKYQLLAILFLFCIRANAQDGDPGLPGGDPDVPIDGGISILLIAGTAFGIKKIRDLNQKIK